MPSLRASQRVGDSFVPAFAQHRAVAGAVLFVAALAASALVNRAMATRAERKNPPRGKFIEVRGLRLHYIEQGQGEVLVLLHGNSGMIEDFTSSGIVAEAAQKYRVIVFDRPGFGYSERPRGTIWTHDAQADLIAEALSQIGVSHATVLGHSWGASIAVALGLRHREMVSSLVLASGYYYPTPRSDVLVLSGPSLPVIGDIMSHTISPLLGRLMQPFFMHKMFRPAPIPAKFDRFPKEMALRPSQIRASAAETALMIPDAFAMQKSYAELKMPVVIIAGAEDKIVDTDKQSTRLHHDVKHSTLRRIEGAGHMVHQTATDEVLAAIDEAAGANLEPLRPRSVAHA
jgi:pimeloyl-ACP methyl ester carboxylesterase